MPTHTHTAGINNPHDVFFRENFERQAVAEDYVPFVNSIPTPTCCRRSIPSCCIMATVAGQARAVFSSLLPPYRTP